MGALEDLEMEEMRDREEQILIQGVKIAEEGGCPFSRFKKLWKEERSEDDEDEMVYQFESYCSLLSMRGEFQDPKEWITDQIRFLESDFPNY